MFLKPLGDVGQIVPWAADVTNAATVERALAGASAAVNLVGILFERGRRTFARVHAEGAENIARAARAARAMFSAPSAWTRANVRRPRSNRMPTKLTAAEAPARARSTVAALVTSAAHGTIWPTSPSGFKNMARSGSRPATRTTAPSWARRRTTCRPRNPVPPKTVTTSRRMLQALSVAIPAFKSAALILPQGPSADHPRTFSGRSRLTESPPRINDGGFRSGLRAGCPLFLRPMPRWRNW